MYIYDRRPRSSSSTSCCAALVYLCVEYLHKYDVIELKYYVYIYIYIYV